MSGDVCFYAVFIFLISFILAEELWEQDLTKDMSIGISTTGYNNVDLQCGSTSFHVNVSLTSSFEGVIYTRGSYSSKKPPCFIPADKHILKLDSKIFTLKIPFDKCRTVMDVSDSKYTNTLIVQHDPDLIMPGDAAFQLDCSFVAEYKVSSDIVTSSVSDNNVKSKITLVDADPANKVTEPKSEHVAVSNTDKVTFKPAKDEL